MTVVMFDRTTTIGSPAGTDADPDYSVAAPLFAACLRFFRRHYSVVGLEQLRTSLLGGMPPRSLLITFDDRWKAPCRSLCRSCARKVLRTGRAGWDQLWTLGGGGVQPAGEPELALLVRYGARDRCFACACSRRLSEMRMPRAPTWSAPASCAVISARTL